MALLRSVAGLPRRILRRAIRNYQRRSRRGVVLMFHEVYADDDALARAFGFGSTVGLLDSVIVRLRELGWDILGLDSALARLESGRSSAPFAVLTFDDGYRDMLSRALPVLQRHEAPFTVYVPTGAITRELHAWWLGLKTLFCERDRVTVAAMDTRFDCSDLDAKQRSFDAVRDWVHRDFGRARQLDQTFHSYDISLPAINDAYFMNESELRALARSPLATIGAHTTTHGALAAMAADQAERELVDNRDFLQGLLDGPVTHLAYPFGGANACGRREFALAARLGFRSAVTTRFGAVLSAHQSRRHQIPRLGAAGTAARAESLAEIIVQL